MPKPNLIPMVLVGVSVVAMAFALAWGLRGGPSAVGVGTHEGLAPEASTPAAQPSQPTSPPPTQPPLALHPDQTWEEVQSTLASAHLVALAPPRAGGEGWLAYAESWEHRASPQACLLRFRKEGPGLRLVAVEANPGSIAVRQALGTDPTDWSLEVERLAHRYAGHGALRLEPAGPGGVALLGERHRLDLRDAQGNPSTQGRLQEIGGPGWMVPLAAHLAEGRRLEAAYLSSRADRLALIEAFPHSGLERLLRLERPPGQRAFRLLPELPPRP